MPLTTAQSTAFRTAILADAALAAHRTAGNHGAIAAYYATAGTGTIWRPDISTTELNTAIVWSEFALLSVQLQNTYHALIATSNVDATSANIRGGFTAIFAAGATRTNLTALAQRVPTKFEQLFTTSQVCSLFGYTPSVTDVVSALGS